MKAFSAGRHRQRGVALIIALILVALATVLATKLSFEGFLELRRTTGMMAAEQALHFGLGAEALAADVLMQDAQTNAQYTTLAGPWAQVTPPFPITPDNNPDGEPIGAMQGTLEDMQGRFNLNTLARIGPDGVTEDPLPLQQFQRLLISVGVEPKWAGLARDWLDQDDVVGNPDGAEDAVYTSQTPPYRAGNWPMMSPSELMNMPGFGADRYRKIAPYVTALPGNDIKINICTAPAVVLESLVKGINGDYSGNPDLLVSERKKGCFPDLPTFGNIVRNADAKDAANIALHYSDKSIFFRLTTRVTLGTTEFTLYSLLKAGGGGAGGGKVTPLLRTFGTP